MGNKSKIRWTDATVNFFTGCKPVSEACDFCYAKGTAEWLQGIDPSGKYQNGFNFTVHVYNEPNDWTKILRSKKPKKIFINSMSDIFYDKAAYHDIEGQFEIMAAYPQHTYQLLTKQTSKRSLDIIKAINNMGLITSNMWMGVTIELQKYLEPRLKWLDQTPFEVRWVSAEPLLGSLDFLKHGFVPDWIVTGGESGHQAREMNMAWVQDIRDFCIIEDIAFFHKQHGGTKKCKCHDAKGCLLVDGQIHEAFPQPQVKELFF